MKNYYFSKIIVVFQDICPVWGSTCKVIRDPLNLMKTKFKKKEGPSCLRILQKRLRFACKMSFSFVFLFFITSILSAGIWKTNNFEIANNILKNPNTGFCFMVGGVSPVERMQIHKMQVPSWVFDVCPTVYFRLDWALIVDKQGNYKFDELDRTIFSGYREKGLRFAFRIMASNPHSDLEYVTPKQILGKIPTVSHISEYGKKQEDPVFWDDLFIKKHGKMIKALGEYIEKHPEVDYVDLGGMGDWGEMHLNRWTEEELKKAGFTGQKYINAVFQMMEQMERYLPKTTKAFCFNGIFGMPEGEAALISAQIIDRAVRHNWWLRHDGFSTEGTGPGVAPYFEKNWQKVGIIAEPCGGINRNWDGSRASVKKYFDTVIKHHPSIANIMGIWDLKRLSKNDIEICREAAGKIAYRFAIKKVIIPEKIAIPNKDENINFPIKIVIANNGNAHYYGSSVFKVKLVNKKNKKVLAEQPLIPNPPISQLLPGKEQAQVFLINIPRNFETDEPLLYLAVEDYQHGALMLGNKGQEKDGRILLGELKISHSKEAQSLIFDISKFSLSSTESLYSTDGVSIKKNTKGNWEITGTSSTAWWYGCTAKYKIKPNARYKMKIKVRAWQNEIKGSKLFFKICLVAGDDKDIRNINSSLYDFNSAGQWQEFLLEYNNRQPDEARLYMAIEKGKTAPSSIKAEIESWTLEESLLP